jgi:two-component system chemotaxis sensor kinase CheA
MVDQEILNSFLEEAFELYEELGQKLLDLESDVTNQSLINDVFRSFHTIKGGASFLDLTAMVDLCHRCEDIFDLIRSGDRVFVSTDMDVFSSVLSVLGGYFVQLKEHNMEIEYPADLISLLDGLKQSSAVNSSSSEKDQISGHVENFDDLFDSIKAGLETTGPEYSNDLIDSIEGDLGQDASEDLDDLFDSIKEGLEVSASHNSLLELPLNDSSEFSKKSLEVSPSINKAKKSSVPIKVDSNKIDDIMNLVGELVLTRNRLQKVSLELGLPYLTSSVSSLDHITTELQSSVMNTRMQPIKRVFQRFPLLVRDAARSLDKNVELVTWGENTEIDKNLVDSLSDPMIHMIRNSVDHGIESPLDRLNCGKAEKGIITLAAEKKGNSVEILISDDGKGLCPEFMKRKGVEKNVISQLEADEMSDEEALQIIFLPGFSTVEVVTNMSGRGVGMDVVRSTMQALNGNVFIESEVGKGTTFRLQVPLTVSILQTLMVVVGPQKYAIPLQSTSEIFPYDINLLNEVDGQALIRLRESSIPVFYMDEMFSLDSGEFSCNSKKVVVVVSHGASQVGLVVDRVLGQEEVVIKPLGAFLSDSNDFAGATITGDGDVALILEINKLFAVS